MKILYVAIFMWLNKYSIKAYILIFNAVKFAHGNKSSFRDLHNFLKLHWYRGEKYAKIQKIPKGEIYFFTDISKKQLLERASCFGYHMPNFR